MTAMIFVTSIISSAEWIKLQEAAAKQFFGETLARGEIMWRFSLSRVQALKAASDADRARVQREHQATMTALEGRGRGTESRLQR